MDQQQYLADSDPTAVAIAPIPETSAEQEHDYPDEPDLQIGRVQAGSVVTFFRDEESPAGDGGAFSFQFEPR